MEMFLALQAAWEGNPPFTDGFYSQKVSIAQLFTELYTFRMICLILQ